MKEDMFVRGLVFELDKVNSNGRIYTTEAVENAFNKMHERIVKGESFLGEMDTPKNITIDLDKVAAIVHNLEIIDDKAYVEMRILKTQNGLMMEKLLTDGSSIQINSRGTGIIDQNSNVTNFEIITFDLGISEDSRFNVEVKKVETQK